MSELADGFKELDRKLGKLKTAVGIKALRNATTRATTPVVRRMKALAPRGSEAHRTYKGRLVAPGFGSRSVIKRSRFNKARGAASVTIGVKKEAFYLIQFYDSRPGRTPYRITERRVSVQGRRSRVTKAIKPYTLTSARPWFSKVFIGSQSSMVKDMRKILRQNIERAARGN